MSIIKNNGSFYEANYRSFHVFENMTSNMEVINAFEQDQEKSTAMLGHIIDEETRFTVKEFVRLMDALRMEVPPRLREAVAESEAAPYCGPCCGGEDEFEEATKEDTRPVFCFGSPNCPGGSLCGDEVNEEATDF